MDVEVRKLTARFRLVWTDNWRPQLEQIKNFLESQGVRTERIVFGKGAFHLPVGEIRSVRLAASLMFQSGGAYKKRAELSAVFGYLSNGLTGNQAIAVFNNSVRIGNRSGYERKATLPLTYLEARKLQYTLAGNAARSVRQKVDNELRMKITEERIKLGLSVKSIASMHKMADKTITRILRESLGVSRLERRGDQSTLD